MTLVDRLGGAVIQNLPGVFPLDALERFDFGDVDAQSDPLLKDCFYHLDATREFLRDNKVIAIGERGAGKTALFRQIASERVKFDSPRSSKQIVIPIEEELEYKTFRAALLSRGDAWCSDESLKYRMVWELFVLQRILAVVDEIFIGHTNQEVRKASAEMRKIFGDDDISLLSIIASSKYSISLRLEPDQVRGVAVPVLAVSAQPVTAGELIGPPRKYSGINLHDYKTGIQAFLASQDSSIYVVVDRLDEFVVREDYETQKCIVQGLLECERSYQQFENVRFKLFLRRDLFEKLDLSQLGPDKVRARSIELKWKESDIRGFVASRLMYNFARHLKLESLRFSIRGENLYVDHRSLDDEVSWAEGVSWPQRMLRRIPVLWRLVDGLARQPGILERWKREGRRVSLTDEYAAQIITSVFPRRMRHVDAGGRDVGIDFREYLSTHFQLGTGETTPRLILTFIQECLSACRVYYRSNPDETVELDERGEYPLFKTQVVQDAYTAFRRAALANVVQSSGEWESSLSQLIARRDRHQLSASYIRESLGMGSEQAHQFLAFLTHVGYVSCLNPYAPHDERRYSIPVIFR